MDFVWIFNEAAFKALTIDCIDEKSYKQDLPSHFILEMQEIRSRIIEKPRNKILRDDLHSKNSPIDIFPSSPDAIAARCRFSSDFYPFPCTRNTRNHPLSHIESAIYIRFGILSIFWAAQLSNSLPVLNFPEPLQMYIVSWYESHLGFLHVEQKMRPRDSSLLSGGQVGASRLISLRPI